MKQLRSFGLVVFFAAYFCWVGFFCSLETCAHQTAANENGFTGPGVDASSNWTNLHFQGCERKPIYKNSFLQTQTKYQGKQ